MGEAKIKKKKRTFQEKNVYMEKLKLPWKTQKHNKTKIMFHQFSSYKNRRENYLFSLAPRGK